MGYISMSPENFFILNKECLLLEHPSELFLLEPSRVTSSSGVSMMLLF